MERDRIILMHLCRLINDRVTVDPKLAVMDQLNRLDLGVFGAFTNKFIQTHVKLIKLKKPRQKFSGTF